MAKNSTIFVHCDFSSHEVRNSGICSGDLNIMDFYKNTLKIKAELTVNYADSRYKKIIDILNKETSLKKKSLEDIKAISDKYLVENSKFVLDNVPKDIPVAKLKRYLDLYIKEIGEADMHRANYARFYGVEPHLVSKEQRSVFKALIFSTLYGKSAWSLAMELGITIEEMNDILGKFFGHYDKLKEYLDKCIVDAVNKGVLIYPNHRERRIYAAMLSSFDPVLAGTLQRLSLNTIIQGFSADLNMKVVVELQRFMYEAFYKKDIPAFMRICNTTHDSVDSISSVRFFPVLAYIANKMETYKIEEYVNTLGINYPGLMFYDGDRDAGFDWTAMTDIPNDSFVPTITEIVTSNKNLDQDEVADCIYNAKIIFKAIQKEAEIFLNTDRNVMLLKPDIISNIGLRL